MAIHSLQTSFNAGELTPLLDMRVGVEKYANGCRQLKNAIVSIHGPVSKRPGMMNMGAAENNAVAPRLMGLNFSSTTSFVVEITKGKFRFWSNGVLVPFTLNHPYGDTDFNEVQAAQVNDVIYLTHPLYTPRILERFGDTDWRLREIHQPATGWTDPTPATPATGNAVLERWVIPQALLGQITTWAMTEIYTGANPPTQVVPESGAPTGTGNEFAISVQRVRGWFIPPTTGTYRFRSNAINYSCQVKFNSTAYGPASGAATVIQTTTPNLTNDTADFALTAGSPYYIEFWHFNFQGQSTGTFKYYIGGADQGPILKQHLAANLNTKVGTTLDGWPALLDENTDARTITPSAMSGNITLTASAAIWQAGHVGAWWQIAHRREDSFVEIVSVVSGAAATETAGLRVLGRYAVYTYGVWTGTLYIEELNPDGSTWSVIRTWRSNSDRNVIDSGIAEREATLRLRVSSIAHTTKPRFLLEVADSKVYGLVRITAVTSSTAASATVYSPLHATTATPYWTEGAWSAIQGYPRAVCLHQQRTQWGGTRKRPQSIWGSVTGDFENFRRSTFDDGSYLYQIASENSFLIQWMLSQGDLLIGTSQDEWIAQAPQDEPITPTNLAFRRQSANGSDYRQAVLIRETVVFAQRNGLALSRMIYRENGRYGASDISILASHLFLGEIKQMAWQAQPSSVLWVVMKTGKLVGLTYEEDQNVFACHEHTTDGLIKSVAVIHGPQGDEVWLAVDRGTTASPVYRIERLEPRTLFAGAVGTTASRRCYVDAAVLKESTTAFSSMTGLDHLNGKEVAIFADGAQQPHRTVTSGAVAIDPPAKIVCVGLPFVSTVQPMKLEAQMQDGTAQGRKFKVSRVMLRLLDTLGGRVSARVGGREEVIGYREVETPMDAAPPLFSGDKHLTLESGHEDSADPVFIHDEPLPFTLCGMVVMVDIYGN